MIMRLVRWVMIALAPAPTIGDLAELQVIMPSGERLRATGRVTSVVPARESIVVQVGAESYITHRTEWHQIDGQWHATVIVED
jgi:hypothetical protein